MSYNLEQASSLTYVHGAGATAGAALTGLSGAATTYSTSAINFAISGIAYTKAAVAGGASPTTDGNTSAAITLTASKARSIVWAVNSAGTVSVYAGSIVDWNGTGDVKALPFPPIPTGVAPFAVHALMGGSTVSGTWTFGSSNWNATGITVGTVRNLAQLSSNPVQTT